MTRQNPSSRPDKKSETLEVRLSHAAKIAFMARCRDEGRTASEAVRVFIEARSAEPGRGRRRPGLWQAFAALIAGLVLGAVAAPSLAQTLPDAASRTAFDRLDRDHDGVVSFDEYRAR